MAGKQLRSAAAAGLLVLLLLLASSVGAGAAAAGEEGTVVLHVSADIHSACARRCQLLVHKMSNASLAACLPGALAAPAGAAGPGLVPLQASQFSCLQQASSQQQQQQHAFRQPGAASERLIKDNTVLLHGAGGAAHVLQARCSGSADGGAGAPAIACTPDQEYILVPATGRNASAAAPHSLAVISQSIVVGASTLTARAAWLLSACRVGVALWLPLAGLVAVKALN